MKKVIKENKVTKQTQDTNQYTKYRANAWRFKTNEAKDYALEKDVEDYE